MKIRKKAFYIRDPVSGDLRLNGVVAKLIEDERFQRLRYVKQLGFSYLVFPGAHHTRFEHSLGTWSITNEISKRLLIEENEELCIAGLLHDVGHMPMSHESEGPIYAKTKMLHEDIGRKIITDTGMLDCLSSFGLSKKKVLNYFDGNSYGKIITGAIGSDRIDYLMRDAYYTGVAHGVTDYYRLRNVITYAMGEPAVFDNGIEAVESFLAARYYMYSSVYFHHACLIANGMYKKALALALESGSVDPYEFVYYDDTKALNALSAIDASKQMINDLLNRKLFKRAYYYPNFKGSIKIPELCEAVEKAGLKESEYIADIIPFKAAENPINIVFKEDSSIRHFDELSQIFKTLSMIQERRKIIIVACKRKFVKRVSDAMKKIL